jgi:hypothetical protein
LLFLEYEDLTSKLFLGKHVAFWRLGFGLGGSRRVGSDFCFSADCKSDCTGKVVLSNDGSTDMTLQPVPFRRLGFGFGGSRRFGSYFCCSADCKSDFKGEVVLSGDGSIDITLQPLPSRRLGFGLGGSRRVVS